MKICQNCGNEMADNMNFCPKCHAKYLSTEEVKSGAVQSVDQISKTDVNRKLTYEQELTLYCAMAASWNNPSIAHPVSEWADLPNGEKSIRSYNNGVISLSFRAFLKIPSILMIVISWVWNVIGYAPVEAVANCRIDYRDGNPYINPAEVELKPHLGGIGYFCLFIYLLAGLATYTVLWWIIIPMSIYLYKRSQKGIIEVINKFNEIAPVQMNSILIPQKSSYSFFGKNKEEIAREGLRILKQKPYPNTTLYAFPNLDNQKLQNAIAKYAPSLKPDDVIFQIDENNSNGTQGIIFTTEGIRTSNVFAGRFGNVRYQYLQGIANDGSGYLLVYDPISINTNSIMYRKTFNENEWNKDVLDFIAAMKAKQLKEDPE